MADILQRLETDKIFYITFRGIPSLVPMAQGTKYPTTCKPRYTLPHQTDVTQRQSNLLLNENSARAVNLTVTHSAMSSSPNESKTLDAFLGMEEAVDYGSDTSVQGDTGTMADT